MPILSYPHKENEWIEPDDISRPVVTFGIVSDITKLELDAHYHRKGQILLVQRGALSCEMDGGLWIVPPRRAVWIPGGTLHAINATGVMEGYCAFVDPGADVRLPKQSCAISVTPLLRELLIRAAHLPAFYEEGGKESRLMIVLLDEFLAAENDDLHLPMPQDPRLRRIVDRMMTSPDYRGTLKFWAKEVAMSTRSLERLTIRETGMSFGRWRQQLAIMLAVKKLAEGFSIQKVASGLGYESVPSFVTMFRKMLGVSPGRYMAARRVDPAL